MTNEQCLGSPFQENGSETGPNMDYDSYQIVINSCCSYSIAKSESTSQDHWHAASKYRASLEDKQSKVKEHGSLK